MASAATAAAVSLRPPGQRWRLPGSTKSFANAAVFRAVQLRPVKRCVGLEVRMDKRKNELVEIRKMTKQEIEEKVIDLKGELFLLRCKKVQRRPEFKLWDYINMKKHIGRLMTIRREIEIAEGIPKGKSKYMKKMWRKKVQLRPPPSLRPLLESFKERREQQAIKEREEKRMKLERKREKQEAEAAARRERNRATRLRLKGSKSRLNKLRKEQKEKERRERGEGMEQPV